MSTKTIAELTAVTSIAGTDVFVIDDGEHNYKISWSTLLSKMGGVTGFTADNTGKLTITTSDGQTLTATPHDQTKQNTLTFDNVPTSGSSNPVKSGGVFSALAGKQNTMTFDSTPTVGSQNPVTSDGIWQETGLLYSAVTYGPGSPVSFDGKTDGMPPKSCLVDIQPVQAGSGDPSPSNPRAISGWTGANLSVSGADTGNPTVYSVSWQSQAGTVYGGTLDILSGTLTVTWISVDVHDASPQVYNGIRYFRKNLAKPGIYPPATYVMSNVFRTSAGLTQDNVIYINNPGNLVIVALADTSITTTAQFNAFLDANNVQVIYKLAEPTVYHLAPQDVRTLAGENNFWADTGDVTVEYGAFLEVMCGRLNS